MKIGNRSAVVRVQLDLPAERIAELEQLMAKTGMTTRKELFENALTLFKWAVQQKENGRILASIDTDEEGYRELVMPVLASIKHEAKNSRALKSR